MYSVALAVLTLAQDLHHCETLQTMLESLTAGDLVVLGHMHYALLITMVLTTGWRKDLVLLSVMDRSPVLLLLATSLVTVSVIVLYLFS
jgi:hypothetical protein